MKLVCAVIAGILLIWCSTIPLGVPGEWTWTRSPIADDFWFSLIPTCGWAAILGVLVWIGSGRIEIAKRPERVAWLCGLFLVSFGMLGALREAAPPEFRAAKIAWVLYFQGSSGYFTEARKVRNTVEFLAHYDDEVKKGDVLHQGTHPPGLIVGYRGLMWACSHSSWLRKILLATQPADLREAFRIIQGANLQSPTPLTEHDRCVLWLAAILMQACAAATVVPIYSLLRLHTRRITSWQLAAFWPLVPAVTMFSPKSDTCFPFLGCLVLALWLHGLRKNSLWLCVAAAGVFWLGMTLSLALLPIACLAGLMTVWDLWVCRAEDRSPQPVARLLRGLAAGGAAFITLTTVTAIATGCNLLEVWTWNYRNHAGFYVQFPRTYWKWLLVNPIELCLAAGLPLVILALSSVPSILKSPRAAAAGPFWMSLLTWSLLWLTGKNMGEAARLWIFLMPWIIWSAGVGWEALISTGESGFHDARRRWLFAWISQLLAALTIITRVAGFQNHG
ncbi:MAG: hypothetical protein JWN70_3361 [Planctomycetaceae bacterium]|nr:hypothetical protein [Planctomycetaceae bacterium]